MIKIVKRQEPPELKRLREKAEKKGLSPKAAYETMNSRVKGIVRQSLVEEQGKLCAYCMCRIPRDDVDEKVTPIIIEHYFPRSHPKGIDIGQGLDYNNLFAVCNGNRARAGKTKSIDFTCDAKKANLEIRKVNPIKEETLKDIYYDMEGKILSRDPDVKYDLNNILNLNCVNSPLVRERKATLDELILQMNMDMGIPMEEYFELILRNLENEKDTKTPYVGIMIWYLKDMLTALGRI